MTSLAAVQVVLAVLHRVLPAHLGALHPVEQALTLLLAFGPVVLLVVTIRVSRRRHERDGDGPTG